MFNRYNENINNQAVILRLQDELEKAHNEAKEWEYAGKVEAGTENKVAVTVGENVTWSLTADTYVTTLVNNGIINKNGYSLTYGSLSGNGTVNESSGINEVRQTTMDGNAPAYTLNGTRTGSSTKGIIIRNGKKIIRK